MPDTNDFDLAGVTLASAAAWLRGEFDVPDRIADSPLDTSRCEVAFLNSVGNLASYRPACRAALDLWLRGARGMATHVVSPVFLRKYQKLGCLITRRDEIIWRGQAVQAVRLVLTPEGWRHWCEKMLFREGQDSGQQIKVA